MKRTGSILTVVASAVCLILLGMGCSGSSSGSASVTTRSSTASVTALMSADTESIAKSEATLAFSELGAPVPVGEIESLTVTVTEIALDPYVEEGEPDEPKIVIFSGAMDINVLDLTDVSEVLSCVDVPAGVYTKIRLSITNPRLVLTSDPATVITDIHLTANGHLFVSGEFELPEDEFYLIILHFTSLHLVELGNGAYVLTPQVRADVQIDPAVAFVCGTIVSVDKDTDTLVLALCSDEGSEIEVLYTDALIFLPGDTDTPTGTEDDLVEGASIRVRGTLWVDHVLTAESIRILSS
jgi:hypothetical protein